MLLKDSRHTERIVTPRIEPEDDDEQLEGIRCPKCAWRPTRSDLWCCYVIGTPEPPFEACGTNWNTFSTHGRCPGCQHQWLWTSCLHCAQWSPHVDWYETRPSQ